MKKFWSVNLSQVYWFGLLFGIVFLYLFCNLLNIGKLPGHVKLQRITAVEREERKRMEKKEKKDKDEEEERNRWTNNFVKYTLGLKHQVRFVAI